jgi:hypothetical protein
MGDFTVHGTATTKWQGAYFTLRPNGQVYISTETHEDLLDEAEAVLVMVDREDNRLGFQPANEEDESSYTVSSQKVGCTSALRRLGVELPDESERYPAQTDDEHDFPFIVLEADSNRSAPASQPETNESRGNLIEKDEVPDHFVKTSGGDLHAPSEDSTLDDPDPYCTGRDADWQAKELETIPPNFYDHCGSCEDRIAEIEEKR